jgi:cytochrome c oxidase subunit I
MAEAHAEARRGGWVIHGATSWRDYFKFNTDHKVIGIQYIVISFVFFLFAGMLAEVIRAQLMRPNNNIVTGSAYNQLFSLHGTMMIFLFVVPTLTGLANYILPLQIGAQDMAFPKLNALSLWMAVVGGIGMVGALLVGGAESGWSAYPPLSLQTGAGQSWWAVSLFIIGFSSIFGAINFLATALTMRAPGMTIMRMPLFVWSVIATAIIILMGTPVLASALLLMLWDRIAGTHFFQAMGDPLMWQNLFWFYSHPAVYIMILPGFGAISEILPVFSRKPIFGYKMIAFSSLAIAVAGFLVWAHHMFTSGMNPMLRVPFMLTSMVIAVPTGVKIFSWLGTIAGGKLRLTTAMTFALAFIAMFVIGGLSGIFLAAIPTDIQMQDTYFVVAHLHYVLFGGSTMAIFAAIYFWYPKMTGRMLNEKLGQVHFWMIFVGFNLTFLVQHYLGMQGMARRIFTYPPEFATGNLISSLGAFLLAVGMLPFIYNALVSLRKGAIAGPNPWRALTLEWTLPSPPPIHNFPETPVVTGDPYGYGRKLPPAPPATPERKPSGKPATVGGGE